MLKRLLVSVGSLVAPRFTARTREQRWNVERAIALRKACQACDSIDEVVDHVMREVWFPSDQKRTEVLALLRMLKETPPSHICEIGARGGGTLMLFCAVAAKDARVLSIDIDFTPSQLRTYPLFAMDNQRVTCLQADSHAPQTLKLVESWLGQARLDFLFIDGDHTLAGVASDFQMYSPLVRAGGIVGFHDITPDNFTRCGVRTANDTGQVPEFWKTIKLQSAKTQEFVEDPNQDGYGIGVLRV